MERAVRSSDVRSILRQGIRAEGPRVVVFLAPGSGDVAVVAGRRVGGAVQRNRAKRVLRETWRGAGNHGVSAVLVAKPQIVGATPAELLPEIQDLVTRAAK